MPLGAVAEVTVEYQATERRDLGIWLHDLSDNWRTVAHGLVKVDPGLGTRTFDLGVASDAHPGNSHLWAVRLLPEGWASAYDALDAFYRDAAVEEASSDEVNLALLPGATARQSSFYSPERLTRNGLGMATRTAIGETEA